MAKQKRPSKTKRAKATKAKKFNQGIFTPKNPEKYIGTTPIEYRSSWELFFMNFIDTHPSVFQWASESIPIAYVNPFTNGMHTYYPDFFIRYMDKDGNIFSEMVEIKPMSQTLMEKAKRRDDKLAVQINHAKWNAAIKWCNERGYKFRVMTEHQLYYMGRK